MNFLRYFNGNDGKERKKRNDESINGCLKRKSIERKERTWNENTKENLRQDEVSFKISKKTT